MPQSPKEKLGRASWTMLESAKDSATTTIATAIHEGKLKIDQAQAKILNDLMVKSIEAGYHRSYNAFMKEVDSALVDAEHLSGTKKN